MSLIRRFLACRGGATAIEYALLAGLIGLAIITAVTPIGGKLSNIFGNVATNLK